MGVAKYIRISSLSQQTARQEANSKSFDKVYTEKCSGAVKMIDRPEGKKLVRDIENGIITELHVNAIDRLGRNLIDVLTMLEFFNKHNVNLFVESIGMYSLINGKPNPTFKMILSVLGNVSELEREFLLERQRQGIEIAKAKGTYTGRLYGTKMTNDTLLEKYKKVVKELKAGQSLRRAAAIGECSPATALRIQRVLSKTYS